MPKFDPVDPYFEDRVRSSFDQQQFMNKMGVRLVKVEPGIAILELDFDRTLTICSAEIIAHEKDQTRLICMMQATMMYVLK